MKSKLKYLIAPILFLVLSASCAVYAGAQEYTTDDSTVTEQSSDTVPAEGSEENFFSTVYSDLTSYAGEILCAMTFIGSLLLAVAYKKGLLPLLERSLVTISSTIAKLKDNVKENDEKHTQISASIDEKLTSATNAIDVLTERVGSLSADLLESLKDKAEAKDEKRQLRLIVEAQVDMLYDVFMCSALPQYQKDAVGEKIAKMREAIAENECEK